MADNARNAKILFIEDESLLCSLFSDLFSADKDYDYEILNALDLKSAFELLEKNTPDLIVLDLILPYDKSVSDNKEDLSEKMGFSFLKETKANEKYKDIPIIVFSNMNDTDTIQKAKDIGAYDYAVKTTIGTEQFLETIKKALASRIK